MVIVTFDISVWMFGINNQKKKAVYMCRNRQEMITHSTFSTAY